MSDIATISAMLSFRRPAGSQTEAAFIERFLAPLGVKKDQFGNHIKIVGDQNPTTLWSSHTDSVHTKDGYQKIHFDGKYIRLAKKAKSNCLGADCAAGVWIMTEMIKASVPGLYIFHAAEEIGCVGSRSIAMKAPDTLANIKAAIAFDRRGTDSVITHQGGVRGCSNAFALSLAAQLPKRFRIDPTGVLTDTKMYTRIVPECTNLSVGYTSEHHPEEHLDVDHLFELRDHMVAIDETTFSIERDPKAPEPMKKYTGGHNTYSFSSFQRKAPESIYDLVYWHPNQVAKILEEAGVAFEDLHQAVEACRTSNYADADTDTEDLFAA